MKWIAVSTLFICATALMLNGIEDWVSFMITFAVIIAIGSESRYLWKKGK